MTTVTTSSGMEVATCPSPLSWSGATTSTTMSRDWASSERVASPPARNHTRREPRRRPSASRSEMAALMRTLKASVSSEVAPSGPSDGVK